MATQFLAFAARGTKTFDQPVQKEELVSRGLTPVHISPNLAVYASPENETVQLGQVGILIGTVFERTGQQLPLRKATDEFCSRATTSGGHSLVQDVWGGFVALLDIDNERALRVIRDPSGAMPCLYLHHGAVTVIASDVETLWNCGLLDTSIDWMAIARGLYSPDLKSASTALYGCRELLPGHRLSLTFSGKIVDIVWSPWNHVNPSAPEPRKVMVERLRETTKTCVARWASAFDNILLGVSGGLDSSIIAAALADQSVPWSAMTMATSAAEGDERRHARKLCDHLNIPLIERYHRLGDIDVTKTSSGHLPRPFGLIFGQSQDKAKQTLAEQFGFDAFFTGQGGDNVFCYMQSATPLVDRLRTNGLSPGALRTLWDIAGLTQTSIWDVAALVPHGLTTKDPRYRWSSDLEVLNHDLVAEFASSFDHPWLDAPMTALPGKAVHIAKLLRVFSTVDGFSRGSWGPLVTPLLAQPLVELCLSIPTWEWCARGVNRSPVREAFADDLPADLVNRRSKAGPVSFAFEVIEGHRTTLRDFILGGALAEKGLLNLQRLEELLDGRTLIRPPLHFDIMLVAEAEAWARHWTGKLHPHSIP
jgi:asparagine synthase (glutamine-hydrolysing)